MGKCNPDKHHRRSIRLPDYDYTQPGAYFVTVCTHQHKCLFGRVVDGIVKLNESGQIATTEWLKSSEIRLEVELDEFVVMPNHLHGIVWLVGASGTRPKGKDGARRKGAGTSPTRKGEHHSSLPPRPRGAAPKSLGAFIIGFKATVTKQVNQLRATPGEPVWQRNYYEHVIRSDQALDAIRRYIQQNPLRWALDRYNPNAISPDPQAVELWNLMQATKP